MDWNSSRCDRRNVFDWIHRVFVVLTYPIFCDYYIDYESNETLLSLEFGHNI